MMHPIDEEDTELTALLLQDDTKTHGDGLTLGQDGQSNQSTRLGRIRALFSPKTNPLKLENEQLIARNKKLTAALETVISAHGALSANQLASMSAALKEDCAQLRQAVGDINLQRTKELETQLKTQEETFGKERAQLKLQHGAELQNMKLLIESQTNEEKEDIRQACEEAVRQYNEQLQTNRQLVDELKEVRASNLAVQQTYQQERTNLNQQLSEQSTKLKNALDSIAEIEKNRKPLLQSQMTKGLFILGAITAALGNIVTLIAAGISYWVQKRALKTAVISRGIDDRSADSTATEPPLELVTFRSGSFFKFCASFGNTGYLPEYVMERKEKIAPALK